MAALQTAVVLAMLGGTPDGTVLVFSSKSCSWCQVMAPSVQRLKQQGYAIRKVDFDRERSLASRFDIQRLPTTVLLVGGRERERYVGYLEEDQLLSQTFDASLTPALNRPRKLGRCALPGHHTP